MAITPITQADRLRWLRNPPMAILRDPNAKLPSGASTRVLKAGTVAKAAIGPAGAVLGFITAFYSSIGFALFILEESIQQAGFGIFAIQNARAWERMPQAIIRYRQLINSLGKLIEKVDVFFGLQIDLTELSDEERDMLGAFLDETGSLGRDTILEPYIHFYNASRFTADAYETLGASKIKGVNDQLKAQLDAIGKQFEMDVFKLKMAHDERLDKLKIEKALRADELAVAKKREENELASDIKAEFASELIDAIQAIRRLLDDDLEKERARLNDVLAVIDEAKAKKEITGAEKDILSDQARAKSEDTKDALRQGAEDAIQAQRKAAFEAGQKGKLSAREKADKKLTIKIAYDKKDLELKSEFDARDRAEKEVHFNAMKLMEKVRENKEAEARIVFYPLPEETGIIEIVAPEEITVTVLKVVDGDTFDIAGARVRMLGIDSAESNTIQGTSDKEFLISLIGNKQVKILSDQSNQFDEFGRLLGVVFAGELNVNLEMLRKCHAMPLFFGPNRHVNSDKFLAAYRECATPPAIPPAPTPIPELPPPEIITPPPAPSGTLTIHVERIDRVPVSGIAVIIGGTGFRTDDSGNATRGFTLPNSATINIKTHDDIFIAPDIVQEATFVLSFETSQTHTVIVGTKAELTPAPPPIMLPADVINFTGMTARVEIGKIDPPWPIGQAGFTTQMSIRPQRTFTLQELTIGDFESIGIRVNFDSQFSNSNALIVDFTLFKPDGTIVETPEVPTVTAGTWAWAKFAGIFAGPPREVAQKGIYRIRAFTNSNDVFNGTADYFFEVI